MVLALLGRLVWGTTKFAVRHIAVPIAISMATAVILSKLADKVRPKDEAQATIEAYATP